MGLLEHKKRLLVLFCSPNSHGSTRMLLDGFVGEFKNQKDWLVTETDVYSLNAHPCTGCKACAKKDACAFGDWTAWTRSCAAATCWPWPLRCTTTPFPPL